MGIYRGARKYAVTMGNLEILTGNQNIGHDPIAVAMAAGLGTQPGAVVWWDMVERRQIRSRPKAWVRRCVSWRWLGWLDGLT